MSHLVSIQTEVRDRAALGLACQRLQLPPPVHGTAQLFGAQQATGELVRLRGWRYPLVCQLDSGALQYDNFGGQWGAPEELARLLQSYACEKAKLEARRRGHAVTEQPLDNGAIKLVIQLAGGAS